MGILCIRGRVFAGKGEGAKFIKLPWVKRQIAEKLGFIPFSGTLNLRLLEDGPKTKKELRKASSVEILPVAGFCRGKCFKAYLMDNLECAIVVPEIVRYPADVIEIVASVNLREKFQLKDGDSVEVTVPF